MRHLSDEWKKKIGEAHRGKKHSKETIEKIRIKSIGRKLSEATKNKLSLLKKGKVPKIAGWNKGIPFSKETRNKISEAKKGKPTWSSIHKEEMGKKMTGENSPNWIKDRSLLKKSGNAEKDRRSSAYVIWRLEIYKRDNYKCRINNKDCIGKVVAHHILSYTIYPELRYSINNGITLCQFHHPLKRDEEKKLIPVFRNLVEVIRT